MSVFTRLPLFKGQSCSKIDAYLSDRRWDVFDDNGYLFASCPFASAIAPLFGTILTVTPSLYVWQTLSQSQRDLVDLVEMCLSRAPVPREWIIPDEADARNVFVVLSDSPWYVGPKRSMPDRTPIKTRNVKAKDDLPETGVGLTQRRFVPEED